MSPSFARQGLFVLLATFALSAPARADTVQITVDNWEGGFCTLCGLLGYACFSFPEYDPNAAFDDPMPVGATLQNVTAELSGADGDAEVRMELNGVLIQQQVDPGDVFACDLCSRSIYTSPSHDDGFPRYSYGGRNTLAVLPIAGDYCVSQVVLTLEYRVERCGDGVINGRDECDDGNFDEADGCLSSCLNATCGDGFVWAGVERCDDGNDAEVNDACLPGCAAARCGDGVVWNAEGGTEVCDDGNVDAGDGCGAACGVEHGFVCTESGCASSCGDGLIASDEACDDGDDDSDDGCDTACEMEPGYVCDGEPSECRFGCGDGEIDPAEGCDDGNYFAGDGCSENCAPEEGFACEGEPSVCASTCGDGTVASDEGCDDGNTDPGDGCAPTCQDEGVDADADVDVDGDADGGNGGSSSGGGCRTAGSPGGGEALIVPLPLLVWPLLVWASRYRRGGVRRGRA